MDDLTLEQQIHLWKALPSGSKDYTDAFIDALIAKIEQLEEDKYDLKLESLEEYDHD